MCGEKGKNWSALLLTFSHPIIISDRNSHGQSNVFFITPVLSKITILHHTINLTDLVRVTYEFIQPKTFETQVFSLSTSPRSLKSVRVTIIKVDLSTVRSFMCFLVNFQYFEISVVNGAVFNVQLENFSLIDMNLVVCDVVGL